MLGLVDLFSKKTILIEEVPRVYQGDLTISTRVPYAFDWSYSPSKYLSYYDSTFHLKHVLIHHHDVIFTSCLS